MTTVRNSQQCGGLLRSKSPFCEINLKTLSATSTTNSKDLSVVQVFAS